MDFFDNVVNKSTIKGFKERLNNPFGGSSGSAKPKADEATSLQEQEGNQRQQQLESNDEGNTTPCLESTARQHLMSSQDGTDAATNSDENNGDKNSQFAAIAADAEAVAQKAAKGAKNIGTFLFSMANKAGQTVTQTAKQVKQAVESTTILTDFTREQQEFIKEHGGSLQAGNLPWDNCDDPEKAAYIREQILSLSQDKRNFVRSPPNDCEFKFDPQECYPQALSLLKEDPNLNKLRYELVPKLVNEDTFWCNYFYRVSMLRQMSEKGEKAKQGWASSRSSSGEGPDEVGDSIATPHGTIDEPSLSPRFAGSASSATQQKTAITTTSAATAAVTTDRQQEQESFNLDKVPVASGHQEAIAATTASSTTQQYQPQDFESSESRKLFAEADDLKSKLRELNIGSLDEGNDEDNKWEEELQRDLQEFELVSGEDLVDAIDEETLQNEIAQLKREEARRQDSNLK